MKKAFLMIDRGSKENEVKDELSSICSKLLSKTNYQYVSYCFLEVVPPYINEGIQRCIEKGVDSITVMPYFLYPGMKLKESVKIAAQICSAKNIKMAIAKPLTFHSIMPQIVLERIKQTKSEFKIEDLDSNCDIMLIGHGSSDRSARQALLYVVNSLKPSFRSVQFCFLELEHPSIAEGIESALNQAPEALILIPYFLHKGIHIKRDLVLDIKASLETSRFGNAYLGKHLGADNRIVDLILERTKEVEERAGFYEAS
jgi:sirohydrochlorin ferrochelatase